MCSTMGPHYCLSTAKMVTATRRIVTLAHVAYLVYRSDNTGSTQYCSGDQIEKNEVGGACSTYGGKQRCMQGFGVEI